VCCVTAHVYAPVLTESRTLGRGPPANELSRGLHALVIDRVAAGKGGIDRSRFAVRSAVEVSMSAWMLPAATASTATEVRS